MDILRALKREEAKLEKTAKNAMKHLAALKATMKFFGGTTSGTKIAGGKKRRKMSAAGRLAISKATKARWARIRELKNTATKTPKTTKRKISAAVRAKMAKAQKARWAESRAVKAKTAKAA